MKKKMPVLLLMIMVCCLLLSLCACNAAAVEDGDADQAEPVAQAEPLTVVDAEGRDITFPENIEKIAITCNGGTTHEVAIFGGADMIVAQPSMEKFPQLLKMYPQFNDVINGGSFDDVNVEQIMEVDPDIVLVGISSKKGNALIEEMGMPTYTMLIGWAAVDSLKQEFLNIGGMLGNDEKAQALVKHWDDTLGDLAAIIANIPENERKSVYYCGSDITKANNGDWGSAWIVGSGGKCAVPQDVTGEISVEQVLEWNPDVIVTQGGNGITDLLSDDRIQNMTAIKNGAVYECPIGGFWWDRPSPEATLGFLWLAKMLYPEYTTDIDLQQITMDFYEQFYDYQLSEEEYQSFFYNNEVI